MSTAARPRRRTGAATGTAPAPAGCAGPRYRTAPAHLVTPPRTDPDLPWAGAGGAGPIVKEIEEMQKKIRLGLAAGSAGTLLVTSLAFATAYADEADDGLIPV